MVEKKNLYFRHSNNTYSLLLEDCDEKMAWIKAQEFMDAHNFTCYYVRSWKDGSGNLWWDVGSHTEFFIWGFICINI